MAPTLPKTGTRTVELINEFVILLKALQRSFLLQSNVEEVRKEEALRQLAINKPDFWIVTQRAKVYTQVSTPSSLR
jgi:hypothetical protein